PQVAQIALRRSVENTAARNTSQLALRRSNRRCCRPGRPDLTAPSNVRKQRRPRHQFSCSFTPVQLTVPVSERALAARSLRNGSRKSDNTEMSSPRWLGISLRGDEDVVPIDPGVVAREGRGLDDQRAVEEVEPTAKLGRVPGHVVVRDRQAAV